MPRPEHWTDDMKETWLNAHETGDPDHPPLATHLVSYRPEVRILVALPPWVDSQAWLREATNAWDGWLESGAEVAVDLPGHALVASEASTSFAKVDAVEPLALEPDSLTALPAGPAHLYSSDPTAGWPPELFDDGQ